MAPKVVASAANSANATSSNADKTSTSTTTANSTGAAAAKTRGRKPKEIKFDKNGKPINRKKARHESYSKYVYKVLKQVHPDVGISKSSMGIMNNFIEDIFNRLGTQSSRYVNYNKKLTLSNTELQTATRFLLPPKLSEHAVSEATKAVSKFVNYRT
jgi:histone H2B